MRASRLSLRASLGIVLGGTLEGGGRTFDIGPGVVAALGVAKQWSAGAWFVTGSFTASASRTTTVEELPGAAREPLIATDLVRLGVMAGRNFGIVSPYLLARGFAGPVFWAVDGMDVRGSDVHFFQLGAGATVTTASGISVLLEISALGEQAASLGVALRL